MTDIPFGITREEILELAATKVANEVSDSEEVANRATKMIETRVREAFENNVRGRVDAFLLVEMEKLLGQEICPVDIWGQPTGKPTTLKAALAERANVFWNVKVDSDGRESGAYSNKPRHEWLFSKIVNEEFTKAVKQNIVNLVGAFKDAVSAHAAQITKEHIDSIIKVKSLGER